MKTLDPILKQLPEYEQKARQLRETILANLIMIGEIPSPTFREERRMRFLVNRFSESQLINCSTDEKGNGLGIYPGRKGDNNIMVVAHLDSIFNEKIDHTITVHPNYVCGPGVGDNALGLALLASLPEIMETLDIEIDSNLILMGSARSLGKGNIEGLSFFLENSDIPLEAGLCLEGVKLGRLSYNSIGMKRCEIIYRVPESYDWTRFGAVGSIVTINEVINRILEIPLPKRPQSSIVLGSIEGGTSFNTIAREAVLRFEIRSESAEQVEELYNEINNIAAEVSSHTGEEVLMNLVAERKPGGIAFAHPMAAAAREIMTTLNIKPRISPSTSELAAFIARGIPALTIGLSTGEDLNEPEETLEIDPIFTGISQLLGLILAIDKGVCRGSE